MVDESERATEGVIARGRFLLEQIEEAQKDIERFLWPAMPDEIDNVLLINTGDHDALKAFLISKDMSFSGQGEPIEHITGINARLIITDETPLPVIYTKPKVMT